MSNVLEVLKSVFTNKYFLIVLGVIITGASTWYALDATDNMEFMPVILYSVGAIILIAVIGWGLTKVSWRQLKIFKKREKDSNMQRFENEFKRSFKGLNYIKKKLSYFQKKKINDIPWLMLVGLQNSGKTSVLEASGLCLSRAQDNDLMSTIIKSNEDTEQVLKFGNKAVIVDLPGDKFNNETSWNYTLNSLKKHRSMFPVNGLIVTIDIEDLLVNTDDMLSKVATIKNNLEKVSAVWGIRVPIYIVFTKSDLLRGFSEFLNDENYKDATLGVSFGDITDLQVQLKLVQEYLANFTNESVKERYRVLANSDDVKTKLDLYQFPYEFKSLSEKIITVFNMLSDKTIYKEPLLIKGMYFAGRNKDNIMLTIKPLFNELVNNKEIFIPKTQKSQLSSSIKNAIFVSLIIGFCGCLSWFYYDSFNNNKALLNATVMNLNDIKTLKLADAKEQTIANLVRLTGHYQVLEDNAKLLPFNLRGGIYKADDYRQEYRDYLIAAIYKSVIEDFATRARSELNNSVKKWKHSSTKTQEELRHDFYEMLRLYLNLKTPEHADSAYIKKATKSFVPKVFANEKLYGKDKQLYYANITKLILFYVDMLSTYHEGSEAISDLNSYIRIPDKKVIKDSRALLAFDAMTPKYQYEKIKLSSKSGWKRFDANNFISTKNVGLLTSSRTISEFYTKTAWDRLVEKEINNIGRSLMQSDWVLFADSDKKLVRENVNLEELKDKVRTLYMRDYYYEWLKFIGAIKVTQFAELEDSITKLTKIACEGGPIAEILKAAHTNLKINRNWRGFTSEIPGMLKVSKGESNNFELAKFNQLLLDVQEELERIIVSPNYSQAINEYVSDILNSRNKARMLNLVVILNKQTREIENKDLQRIVKNILLSIVRETWRALAIQVAQNIEYKWQTEVIALFKEQVAQKYPFNRNSEHDVSMAEFSDIFHPSHGLVFKFFEDIDALLHSDKGLTSSKWLGLGVEVSREFKHFAVKSKVLSRTMFKNNSELPSIDFAIYPKANPKLNEYRINIYGTNFRYRNDPQYWNNYNWPGVQNESKFSVLAANNENRFSEICQNDGKWALFRALDNAHLAEDVSSRELHVTWQNPDYPDSNVSIKLRSDAYEAFSTLAKGELSFPDNVIETSLMKS